MATADNKDLVRRYIEDVVNTGDVSRIDDFIHLHYTEVYDGRRHEVGIPGAAEHIRGVRRTYPDLHLTVEGQIAEGDWVATSIIARGTHQGEWLGIPPTGKPLVYSGVNVDRILNGKIVEHGGAANLLTTLLAVGAIHPAHSGPPSHPIGTVPTPPLETEYAAYYKRYVTLVPEANIVTVLHDQTLVLQHTAALVMPSQESFRYAPGKWSIREVFGHLIDAERIFGVRAFCFSRGELAHLPSFDENKYVTHSRNDARTLRDLVREFTAVRSANLIHLYTLGAPEWAHVGTASGHPVTVRAIAYVMAGHVRHHVGVLRERYGVG
ncbi:MAG: ester cyclase [Bacteroidetes bacterium]|jgi:predicted ester cyclase|nr:ester cyclase [Bacteroidota bacterium]